MRGPGPCGPRGWVLPVVAGRGRSRLPGLDDLRGGAGPRPRPSWPPQLEPASLSTDLRPRARPATEQDPGCHAGMAMTEKQGGSDVRANTTAQPSPRRRPRLPPHRAQMVLLGADVRRVPRARPGAGRPVVLPGAARAAGRHAQPLAIQRLKDKLGNRSNASAEIEFDGTRARWRVGDEGRGVRTIIEMVTRPASTACIGIGRADAPGVAQAVHHARHRTRVRQHCSSTSR